jgi:hypothetical protein
MKLGFQNERHHQFAVGFDYATHCCAQPTKSDYKLKVYKITKNGVFERMPKNLKEKYLPKHLIY